MVNAVFSSESGQFTRSVDASVTARFAVIAEIHAGAIAVRTDNGAMTYRDLDTQSNRLARWLVARGVARGDLVGLHAHRSAEAIVAILAILKTGAGYAPFDPAYPCDQIQFMARDCAPKLILAAVDAAESDALAGLGNVVSLHQARVAAAGESEAPLDAHPQAEDVAYVMYTSGSTGRPKGVLVPHRAIVRLISDQTYITFGPHEVMLHAAPLAFDASTFEIWGALLHGGALSVIGEARPSLKRITDVIARDGVTIAWFTAGLFHLLVDQCLDGLKPLRQLIAGGDVLSPVHIETALAGLPNCTLVNGYGPTENTTFTCCFRVPRAGWGGGPTPIGPAIAHTHVVLLDDKLHPVADGEAGQLCAGGAGVALGYLNRAEQTAEKFIADPTTPGGRLYLTGDLARMRADGAYEFLGRADGQVKIDGKRVELGEIEETLRRDPAVRDAVVLLREDTPGAKRLVAYAIADATESARDAALARLRALLPAHMVPAELILLSAFPLTPNGKIDRAKLPTPSRVAAQGVTSAVSDVERALAEILAHVLKAPAVDPTANFFDLGATSLKLMEAHAQMQKQFPDLQIVALFEHPSVRDLAASLSGRADAPLAHAALQSRAQKQAAALQRARAARMRP